MTYLTERQRDILGFIRKYQQEHGVAPTHKEICEKFGFSSYGRVYKHLSLLEKKGLIRRDWNQKRGVEPVEVLGDILVCDLLNPEYWSATFDTYNDRNGKFQCSIDYEQWCYEMNSDVFYRFRIWRDVKSKQESILSSIGNLWEG